MSYNIIILYLLNIQAFVINPHFINSKFDKKNVYMTTNFPYSQEYYNFLINHDIIKSSYKLKHSISLNSKNIDKYLETAKLRENNYKIFENNLININKINKQNNSYKLELNKFSDKVNFSNNDFHSDLMQQNINKQSFIKNKFIYLFQLLKIPLNSIKKYSNLPDKLIWDDTILSNVKNQGECGSCWAFSSTGAIEAHMRIHNFTINRLSEQELVDCSNENYGCNGGIMHMAFDYCIENNGLSSNIDYPYTALDGICFYNCRTKQSSCNKLTDKNICEKVEGSNIKKYMFTIPKSIVDIMASLKNGPISIALDANSFVFRFYKDGVIDIPNSNNGEINHAVLLVGYDIDNDGMHWIIQNSWGKDWGNNGYAKLRIKKGEGTLLCQLYGVYPYF